MAGVLAGHWETGNTGPGIPEVCLGVAKSRQGSVL